MLIAGHASPCSPLTTLQVAAETVLASSRCGGCFRRFFSIFPKRLFARLDLYINPINCRVRNLGQFLCSRIGGSKRAISDRRPNRAFLTQSKNCLFDPNFFDRAIKSAHPLENVDFFNGMRGSDCSIAKNFEAHRISHHPRKHTITPYNSSYAGLGATAAAAAAAAAAKKW